MGCVFCASGVAGLKRHMRADEIVAQVLVGRSRLDEGERLRNVVLMGMGEPLHNYEATVRALRLLTHPDGHQPLDAQGHRVDERPRARDRAPRRGLQRADRPRDLAPRGGRRDAFAPHADQQEVSAGAS